MKINNLPNPSRLLISLRDTGYSNVSALADLHDNSLDANASRVFTTVQNDVGKYTITIADDGDGMDRESLTQALKLGSISDKNPANDLGKYGLGLSTASIALARRLEVITASEDGEALYASQDLDEIADKNEFLIELRNAKEDEAKLLAPLGGHGTILRLTNVDRLDAKDVDELTNTLVKEFGRIYRHFIAAGREIVINGKPVFAIDPLMLENKETRVWSEDDLDVHVELDGQVLNETIKLKIVLLPYFDSTLSRKSGVTINSSGFYVVRNQREIAAGETLGLFVRKNDHSRIRIELSYPATLDSAMGLTFSKNKVQINQSVYDALKRIVGPQITSMLRQIFRERRSTTEMAIDHTSSERTIAQKLKLLATPVAEIEKRAKRKPSVGEGGNAHTPRLEPRTRVPRKTRELRPEIKIGEATLGTSGDLYEVVSFGKVVQINWNVDHSFFMKMVVPNRSDKDIMLSLDYLIAGLALAEQRWLNEDDELGDMLQNIKGDMSKNLRILMG